jgi:hypothetical protein
MKVSHVILQQGLAGYRVDDLTSLKRRVKRTASGLPRSIPAQQRMLLRKGDVIAVKLWTSLFGLYRIMEFVGQVNLKTIVTPGEFISQAFHDSWRSFCANEFWNSIITMVGSKWKEFRAMRPLPVPFSILKSGPGTTVDNKYSDTSYSSTSLLALASSARLWLKGDPILRDTLKEYLTIVDGIGLWRRIVWAGQALYDQMPFASNAETLGRLGLKEEPAGKVRVFAMVDAWTHWVMRPLHDFIFSLLRYIPQDGTFDQPRPAERLKEELERCLSQGKPVWVYSIDLSAATDRLPISLQIPLMAQVFSTVGFGYWKDSALLLANLWAKLLVDRDYRVSYPLVTVTKPKVTVTDAGFKIIRGQKSVMKETVVELVRYAVGQPMGALSSWASLAITHHCIVQYAYAKVCESKGQRYSWFSDYAILGDDVVIGNRSVALSYLKILDTIGVEAGLAKSLVSHNKIVMEFAKKLWIPQRADMVSLKELIAASISMRMSSALVEKFSLSVEQMCRFYGLGYRVVTRKDSLIFKLPTRLRIPYIWCSRPGGPWAVSDWGTWIGIRSMNSAVSPTWDTPGAEAVIDAVHETFNDLFGKWVKLVRETDELNKKLPEIGGGFGNEYLTRPGDKRRALAIYNSLEPDTHVPVGVDADRETKVDRMLSDAALWTGEAVDDLIVPDIQPLEPTKGYAASTFFMMWTMGRFRDESFSTVLEWAIEEVKRLDDEIALISERSSQKRSDEEKDFSDSITWYNRWQDWSGSLFKLPGQSAVDYPVCNELALVPVAGDPSLRGNPNTCDVPEIIYASDGMINEWNIVLNKPGKFFKDFQPTVEQQIWSKVKSSKIIQFADKMITKLSSVLWDEKRAGIDWFLTLQFLFAISWWLGLAQLAYSLALVGLFLLLLLCYDLVGVMLWLLVFWCWMVLMLALWPETVIVWALVLWIIRLNR